MSFLLHLNRFIMALGIVHRVNYLLLLPGHHHTVLRGCGWLREHVSAGANHLSAHNAATEEVLRGWGWGRGSRVDHNTRNLAELSP